MAGTLAVMSTNAMRDEWEISFARFIPFPLSTTSASSSSDLIPLPPRLRNCSPRGTWISSSTVAFLRLSPDLSLSNVTLTVALNAILLEEHYVSKLQFSWPQVSCDPGYPARGIRTVLASYRDSRGEIQKFAMRFPSIYEAQSFINTLKEILKEDNDPEPLNIEFGSDISSQSEFMSTNKNCHRTFEEPSFMTPVDAYIPQMLLCMKNDGEEPSGVQKKGPAPGPPGYNNDTILCMKNDGEEPSGVQKKEPAPGPPGYNSDAILPALPPSFATFLMDCAEINQAQTTVSGEIDLKSQIARYMEDSSFQDMLAKVEKVISEIGGDMSMSF